MGKIDKDIPCYGCTKRWATSKDNCHSSCEDYKAFTQERAERAKTIRKKRNEEAMVTDVHIRSILRTTKDLNVNRQRARKR